MARGRLVQRAKTDKSSWTLIIELPPDPVTGKRRQKSTTFHGKRSDAQVALAKLVVEAAGDQVADAGRTTVAQLLERYVEAQEEPKTRRGYRQLARNQIVPLIGRVLLAKVTPARIVAFRAALRGVHRRTKPTKKEPAGRELPETIATTTQLKAFRLVHAALAEAVRWRLIPTNPAAGIKAPSATTKEMRPLDRHQAMRFAAALAEVETFWHAFFLLGLSTGMRLAELAGLRWADVRLDEERVEVRQTIAYVEGEGSQEKGQKGRVVKPYPKGRRMRVLPIDPELVAVLRTHRAIHVARQLHAGPMWSDQDLVFPGPFGRPLDDSPIRKMLTAVCAQAKVPRITPHDLRHTCATLLLLDGVNVKVVSERLGHSTVAITMATYAHVLPGLQEEAAVRMSAILRGTG